MSTQWYDAQKSLLVGKEARESSREHFQALRTAVMYTMLKKVERSLPVIVPTKSLVMLVIEREGRSSGELGPRLMLVVLEGGTSDYVKNLMRALMRFFFHEAFIMLPWELLERYVKTPSFSTQDVCHFWIIRSVDEIRHERRAWNLNFEFITVLILF